MKGLKRSIALWLAASLLTASAADSEDDADPPSSSFSTPDGAVLSGLRGDAVKGRSTDDASGIFGVEVEFCSVADSTRCDSSNDLGSDCDFGCPTRYAWSVCLPKNLPPGVYTATVSAVDDAWNWETDGPSTTVTVAE